MLRLGAAALAAGALVGFIASRTIGVLGFVEYGLQPAPQALTSLLVETTALALLAVPLLDRTTTRPALWSSRLKGAIQWITTSTTTSPRLSTP